MYICEGSLMFEGFSNCARVYYWSFTFDNGAEDAQVCFRPPPTR